MRRGDMRNSYNIVIEKPEGKRPLGIPRLRSANDIKMYFKIIHSQGLD
jgi:hypothetical protein